MAPEDGNGGRLQPLDIVDGRTPEQLKDDGDDRWPDGARYTPPHLTGEARRLFRERQDQLDEVDP